MATTRYRITAVLGKGGFGSVYRASMEAPGGFRREVALKVLSDPDPDPEVLARFRDEARMLGRLRHPNIPGVGPPFRLQGRWAVVMDLVDGVDCHRLLKRTGPVPVRCALEIAAEVASTLQQIHDARDEDGRPMNLLHRDIKPSNLMVTPDGGVFVLDFGNARATFDARETLTTDHVGGTVGFIPPERLEGEEGPAGDVFSLGVVLHVLITGERPPSVTDEPVEPDPLDPPSVRGEALALAGRMRALNPKDRPRPHEVASFARRMAERVAGHSLKDWAGGLIPGTANRPPDELVGQVLHELQREGSTPPPVAGVAAVVAAAMVIASCAGVGLLGLGGQVGFQLADTRTPAPITASTVQSVPVSDDLVVPTRTEVASEPGASPAPSPRGPRPGTSAPTAGGQVVIRGAPGNAWLMQNGRRYAPGAVSPGAYDVYVEFDGLGVHAASVSVRAGSTVTLDCAPRFRRCREATL